MFMMLRRGCGFVYTVTELNLRDYRLIACDLRGKRGTGRLMPIDTTLIHAHLGGACTPRQ